MSGDPCSGQNDHLGCIEETLKTEEGHKEVVEVGELLSNKLDEKIQSIGSCRKLMITLLVHTS